MVTSRKPVLPFPPPIEMPLEKPLMSTRVMTMWSSFRLRDRSLYRTMPSPLGRPSRSRRWPGSRCRSPRCRRWRCRSRYAPRSWPGPAVAGHPHRPGALPASCLSNSSGPVNRGHPGAAAQSGGQGGAAGPAQRPPRGGRGGPGGRVLPGRADVVDGALRPAGPRGRGRGRHGPAAGVVPHDLRARRQAQREDQEQRQPDQGARPTLCTGHIQPLPNRTAPPRERTVQPADCH